MYLVDMFQSFTILPARAAQRCDTKSREISSPGEENAMKVLSVVLYRTFDKNTAG